MLRGGFALYIVSVMAVAAVLNDWEDSSGSFMLPLPLQTNRAPEFPCLLCQQPLSFLVLH
jgi:hypothetical protein